MINQRDLNTKRMLDLMAVNTEDGKMPLYLHEITRILRAMRVSQQESNGSFNYAEFKQKVEDSPMTAGQQAPLIQRLDTLESFMPKSQTGVTNEKTKQSGQLLGNDWTVKVCLSGLARSVANKTRLKCLPLSTFHARVLQQKAHAHYSTCV